MVETEKQQQERRERTRKQREKRAKLDRSRYIKRYEQMTASNIKKSRDNLRNRKALIQRYQDIIEKEDDPLSLIDLSNPLLTYKDRKNLEDRLREKGSKEEDIEEKQKRDFKDRDKKLNEQIVKAGKGKYRDLIIGVFTFNLLLIKSYRDKGEKQRELKKVKGKGKGILGTLTALIVPASLLTFGILMTYFILILLAGFISAMMLSHPEAIKELYENGNLGDAMWMGNVYEDQEIDGKVVVRGNPYARPGCFVYNGVLYCGNCNVMGEDKEDRCSPSSNSGNAGQGELTDEAVEWAKDYEAAFIGDSLGVGVKPVLEKVFPKMTFDVLSSRFMITSTPNLNGIDALKKMVKDGKVKDVLVVALGTNGGLTQDMMEEFYSEIPKETKKVIYINTGSKGGSDGYGNINYENISEQIKEFVGKKDNTYYLDWLTFSHKYGWDKITSDSVHMNSEGVQLYSDFITQGLYDIEKGPSGTSNDKCESGGDLGALDIGELDDSKLRSGVNVYTYDGVQPWVKKVINLNSNLFKDSNDYSGYRAGDSGDHGSGLALDYMTNMDGKVESDMTEGDAVARWYIDNFEALNVKYVIWRQRIWLSGATEWQTMEHRGDPTQNHYDHVHVSFNSGEGDMSKVKMPKSADAMIKSWKDTKSGGEGFVDGEKCPTLGSCTVNADTMKIEARGSYNVSEEDKWKYEGQLGEFKNNKDLKIDMELVETIQAMGEKKENPGVISHSGYRRGILDKFKINAKDPDWLDADYINKFLTNGYPDSKLIGYEDLIVEMADKYGVSIGVFFGQIATESSMGRVPCGGKYNFGCVRYVEGNKMGWSGVNTANGMFLDPPSAEEYLKYWFDLIKTVYIDDNKEIYPDYLQKYSPSFENDHSKFEKNMYGVLVELGYDLETKETKTPGGGTKKDRKDGNNTDSQGFTCPDNCNVTKEDKDSGGTGKVKTLEKGKSFENEDDLTRTDLGFTTDKVTPESLDKAIEMYSKEDSLYRGMGEVFYKAGMESGYDPRYVLAHAALETGWGTSQILRDKYNSFGIAAYDDTPYQSAYDYESIEAGIIEGAAWIYKNYYGAGQKTLYDMRHDPTGQGHNYATDPEWHVKIAANMKAINKAIGGASDGGSVVNASNMLGEDWVEARSEESGTCTLDGITFVSPLDMSEDMKAQINYYYQDEDYTNHRGMDFVYKTDSTGQSVNGPINAVADGEVVTVGLGCQDFGDINCGGGWGNHVILEHENGMRTNYAHLKEGTVKLKVGDKVEMGEELGKMGSSGNSTGVHLHFELWENSSGDSRIDPYPYFDWSDFLKFENKEHPRKNNYKDDDLCKKGSRKNKKKKNTPSTCTPRKKKKGNGLTGGDNAEKVYNFFSDLGFSDEAIAGIMGNLMVESGIKPYIIQTRFDLTEDTPISELDKIDKEFGPRDGYQGRGLVQWSHGERWDALTAWAEKNGKERWDLETQLEYLAREMGIIDDPEVPVEYGTQLINNGTFPYGKGVKGLDNFKKTKDIEAAVYTFERYERAAASAVNFPQRVKYAKEFYAQMEEWKK